MPTRNVVEVLEEDGSSPFARWFLNLDAEDAAKVNAAIVRMSTGNLSDVKAVGGGVFERRIHWGPGYRIYFGQEGEQLILLLGGGVKKRQENDIRQAKDRWARYKIRKKGGGK